MEPVLERRGDAEVAAAAAERPEQVGVALVGHRQDLAVRRHELASQQVVDGEPVLAHQPTEPTAEREPSDPGRRDDAAR